MPELPEVETIRLGLQKYLVGHTLKQVQINLPKMISGEHPKILGATFVGVRRFGKGLVLDLNNGYSIAVHVKMTGQLIYEGKKRLVSPHPIKVGKLPGPYTHLIFYLDHDAVLYYNDMRQFGWVKIAPTKDISTLPFFKELGPEPFKDLTLKKFILIVSTASLSIKSLLMDQKKIGGIGNIYANDALFIAKIHPKRQAKSLSKTEQERLFDAIEAVLRKGLEVGGASEWHYVDALGMTGSYQNFFQVYGKDGKLCPNCGTKIERITLSGRGTFLCPNCQKN